MQLSKRENVGLWIGVIAAAIPAMIVAGFFPEFNVLSTWSWIAIATIGSLIAGVVASKNALTGGLSGALAGLGTLLGVIGYVAIRNTILPTEAFLRLEIAFGAIFGAAPGLFTFFKFARANKQN